MNELIQISKILTIQSLQYNTFRGSWKDMPESKALCWTLGLVSLLLCVLVMYEEYDPITALVAPILWLGSMWVYATDGGAWKVNLRLLTAAFLYMIPITLFFVVMGRGHEYMEVFFGFFMSAGLLTLKARG